MSENDIASVTLDTVALTGHDRYPIAQEVVGNVRTHVGRNNGSLYLRLHPDDYGFLSEHHGAIKSQSDAAQKRVQYFTNTN